MTRAIERSCLGALTKIGQGGQGVVYSAPSVTTRFAASMVYKEYKPHVRTAELNVSALSAMPTFLESLPYAEGERLVSCAAWPCAVVEDHGATTGFVMPMIPDRFFTRLTTVMGVSKVSAEFQHLLNPTHMLAQRGISITDEQRYDLLREVASSLAFLHKNGVCVGDISPKNLLFCLSPAPAVYFIDCDAMRVNGQSALLQRETSDWEVPRAGEEPATNYSDTYKLGLLALRLLAGDQYPRDPGFLPAATPAILRQVVVETLTRPPEKRPPPAAWTYALASAVEGARQHAAMSPPPAATAPPPAASGPTPTTSPTATVPITSPVSTHPAWTPPTTSGKSASKRAWVTVVAVLAILIGLSELAATLDKLTRTSGGWSGYPSTQTAATPPWYAPTSALPPPMIEGADTDGERCDGGYHLRDRSGWATRSARGTAETSCALALDVLTAYWDQYSNAYPSGVHVLVDRAPACQGPGAQCSGSGFVMWCQQYFGEGWITCTGGDNARVYLF
ncbi:MAG: hypothetical protein JOZ49_09175 [Mycolicibacterium sp.]|nr:hypothetical protein [Mycolicibacterium sp.]